MTETTTTPITEQAQPKLQGAEKTSRYDLVEGDWVAYKSTWRGEPMKRRQVKKTTKTQVTLVGGSRFQMDSGNEIGAVSRKAEIFALGSPMYYGNTRTADQEIDYQAAQRVIEVQRQDLINKVVNALPRSWHHFSTAKLEGVLAALEADLPKSDTDQ